MVGDDLGAPVIRVEGWQAVSSGQVRTVRASGIDRSAERSDLDPELARPAADELEVSVARG